VLNYVCAVPVLVSVGLFTLYHLNALVRNTTTIERWEKDKAATLVRRGTLREIKFPYVPRSLLLCDLRALTAVLAGPRPAAEHRRGARPAPCALVLARRTCARRRTPLRCARVRR
jgi:hypothetical protein